ncbi:MAG: hypothetical protein HGA53_00695 [Anaerolineaceae bacterium]|nr:hypothetical protein [Anaerolineaceae bacterium]NTV35449.1 hypothetical protein [Anaerolineaceae bacterium]
MPKIDINQKFDDETEVLYEEPIRRPVVRAVKVKRSHTAFLDDFIQHHSHETLGSQEEFTPTFHSSRHEREWILNYLGPFYENGFISDVIARVKGGKEANVYCCEAHESTGVELLAAKVYRPRMFRNLRNDLRYRQGRAYLDPYGKEIQDHGALHAIQKGTRIGKEMQHASWIEHEYKTMEILFEAGADVPRPITRGENTILMEYLGEAGLPAPTLFEVTLQQKEARPLFDRLLHNVELMLENHRIHGDFSAYNVLYWEGDVHIIDFPQVVDPRGNREAQEIFFRDVERLCQYFRRYGIKADSVSLARKMWEDYSRKVDIPSSHEAEDLLMRLDQD